MSSHLTAQLIVEAIDGTLGSTAREHLGACGACRAEVDRVRAILQEAESAAPVREPSPLFWDHFADRVREATSVLPVQPQQSWVASWWRPVALIGATVAVVAVLVSTQRATPVEPGAEIVVAGVEAWPTFDAEGWDLVVSLTEDLGWDDVQQVARPKVGTADAVIDELSPQERAAFVKLLKQEMGGLE
jgi:hypothetical protein